jgi:hypothetical protein
LLHKGLTPGSFQREKEEEVIAKIRIIVGCGSSDRAPAQQGLELKPLYCKKKKKERKKG